MSNRPNASFAALALGLALLTSCTTKYVTSGGEAGEAGAANNNVGGAGGVGGDGGASGTSGEGGTYGGSDYCSDWYVYNSDEYWSCLNGGVGGAGGVGGDYGGVGGVGGTGYAGGAGGYGCDPAWDPWCGAGGSGGVGGAGGTGGVGGTGIGGAGGDPCSDLGDPPFICSCYYGLNNTDYYACLNRYDAQNGGVGGAPATLCEQFAPWSDEHERCINYYLNGNAGSYAEGGASGATETDAGSPE